MKKLIAPLAALFVLAGCGPACDPGYVQRCSTTVATGFSMDGKVVVTPITTCFCFEELDKK